MKRKNTPTRVTAETSDKIADLLHGQNTIAEVAVRFGVTRYHVITIRNKIGMPPRERCGHTPEFREKVARTKGTLHDVAKQFKVGTKTIRGWRKEFHVELKDVSPQTRTRRNFNPFVVRPKAKRMTTFDFYDDEDEEEVAERRRRKQEYLSKFADCPFDYPFSGVSYAELFQWCKANLLHKFVVEIARNEQSGTIHLADEGDTCLVKNHLIEHL